MGRQVSTTPGIIANDNLDKPILECQSIMDFAAKHEMEVSVVVKAETLGRAKLQ